jgi:hypothetical protein
VSASRFTALLGGAALALVVVACQTKDDFEQCAMTERVQADCKAAIAVGSDQCSEAEVFCYDSCVVKDHPQCVDGPCVMYESRLIGETQPVNSVEVSFCTVPCHAEACPADATCRKILSLKTSCTKDSECTTNSPWAVCETPRFCETSRKECESAADCTGEACLPDDAAARFCTYKFCIPEKYAPGT